MPAKPAGGTPALPPPPSVGFQRWLQVAGCTVQVAAVRKNLNYLFFSEKPLQWLAKVCNGLQYLNLRGFCHRGAEAPSGSAVRRGTPDNDSSDQRMVTPRLRPAERYYGGQVVSYIKTLCQRTICRNHGMARLAPCATVNVAYIGHITMGAVKAIVSDYRYFFRVEKRIKSSNNMGKLWLSDCIQPEYKYYFSAF